MAVLDCRGAGAWDINHHLPHALVITNLGEKKISAGGRYLPRPLVCAYHLTLIYPTSVRLLLEELYWMARGTAW